MTRHYGRTHMGLHIGISYGPATFDCMETVGQRVRRLRRAKGWNQTELGVQVGVDQSTLSDIESKDSAFSAALLMRLAEALEVSAGVIMLGHDETTWPFQHVPIERFLALDVDQRGYVEGKLASAIEEFDPAPSTADVQAFKQAHQRKKPPPKRRAA